MLIPISEADLIGVAGRCGKAFARKRWWVEEDDAVSEAYVIGVEEAHKYRHLNKLPDDPISWLGSVINWRLTDWQRRQKFHFRRTANGPVELITQSTNHDDWVETGREDIGYWFVERMIDYGIQQEQEKKMKSVLVIGKHLHRRNGLITPREHQVILLSAQGATTAKIATTLFIGEETVKSYKRSIIFKLCASNFQHVIAIAYENGLLEKGDVDNNDINIKREEPHTN